MDTPTIPILKYKIVPYGQESIKKSKVSIITWMQKKLLMQICDLVAATIDNVEGNWAIGQIDGDMFTPFVPYIYTNVFYTLGLNTASTILAKRAYKVNHYEHRYYDLIDYSLGEANIITTIQTGFYDKINGDGEPVLIGNNICFYVQLQETKHIELYLFNQCTKTLDIIPFDGYEIIMYHNNYYVLSEGIIKRTVIYDVVNRDNKYIIDKYDIDFFENGNHLFIYHYTTPFIEIYGRCDKNGKYTKHYILKSNRNTDSIRFMSVFGVMELSSGQCIDTDGFICEKTIR